MQPGNPRVVGSSACADPCGADDRKKRDVKAGLAELGEVRVESLGDHRAHTRRSVAVLWRGVLFFVFKPPLLQGPQEPDPDLLRALPLLLLDVQKHALIPHECDR